jgi:predicted nucleotidyltransferase
MCRWLYEGCRVEILSAKSKDLGFTNRWYEPAMSHPKTVHLQNGLCIKLFELPWFIASKMKAVLSRGWKDLRSSHNFEDIVYLWDNIPTMITEMKRVPPDLNSYFVSTLS